MHQSERVSETFKSLNDLLSASNFLVAVRKVGAEDPNDHNDQGVASGSQPVSETTLGRMVVTTYAMQA